MTHSTIANGINDYDITYLTRLPLGLIELGFVVLCFVRLFGAKLRDEEKSKKSFPRLVYPNGVAAGCSTTRHLLADHQTTIFNEFNDCLLEDCIPSNEQSIASSPRTTLTWAFVDKERLMKLPRHHKHKHHKHHTHARLKSDLSVDSSVDSSGLSVRSVKQEVRQRRKGTSKTDSQKSAESYI